MVGVRRFFGLLVVILMGWSTGWVPESRAQSFVALQPSVHIVVNDRVLSPQVLATLGVQPGVIPPGRYWYDTHTGAWGLEGSGTLGFVVAGLALGPMKAQASGGRTGVFVNGRQVTHAELAGLAHLNITVIPGRYWCRANGDCGQEGNPTVLVNLRPASHPATPGNYDPDYGFGPGEKPAYFPDAWFR